MRSFKNSDDTISELVNRHNIDFFNARNVTRTTRTTKAQF